MAEYPNPCTRCGFCCLAETCPMGQWIYEIGKHDPCPGLSFDGDIAECKPFMQCASAGIPAMEAKGAFGVGKGCCMSARAFKDGVQHDFASLDAKTKIAVVRKIRKGEKSDE